MPGQRRTCWRRLRRVLDGSRRSAALRPSRRVCSGKNAAEHRHASRDRDAPQHPLGVERAEEYDEGLRTLTARTRLLLQPRRRCWCDECAERCVGGNLRVPLRDQRGLGRCLTATIRAGAGSGCRLPRVDDPEAGQAARVKQGQVVRRASDRGTRRWDVVRSLAQHGARRDWSRAPCWLRASLLPRSWRDASRGARQTAMARQARARAVPGGRSSPPASRSSRSSSGGRARRRTCEAARSIATAMTSKGAGRRPNEKADGAGRLP